VTTWGEHWASRCRKAHDEQFSLPAGVVQLLPEGVAVILSISSSVASRLYTYHKVVRVAGHRCVPHLGELELVSDGTLVEQHRRDVDIKNQVTVEQPAIMISLTEVFMPLLAYLIFFCVLFRRSTRFGTGP